MSVCWHVYEDVFVVGRHQCEHSVCGSGDMCDVNMCACVCVRVCVCWLMIYWHPGQTPQASRSWLYLGCHLYTSDWSVLQIAAFHQMTLPMRISLTANLVKG